MIIILSITIRFLWFNTTIERDEGTFAYMAWRFQEGEKLYEELYDLKGPVTYILYALSFTLFGNNIQSIRFLNNMLFFLSIPIFFMIVKKWYKFQVAFFSTLIYGIFMSAPIYEGHLAMTESLSIPFIISSIFLANAKGGFLRENFCKILSGTLMCVAFLMRQTAIAGFLLLFLFIYVDDKQQRIFSAKHGVSEKIGWALLGISIPFLIFIVYFILEGTFTAFLHEVFMRPLSSIRLGGTSGGYDPFPRILLIAEALPLWILGIGGVLNCIANYQTRHLKSLLWLLLFSGMVVIPPSFSHIYLVIVPPLSVFAGIYMTKLLNSKSSVHVLVLFATLLIMSAFFQTLQYPNTTIQNIPELSNWDGYLLYSDLRTYDEQISLANHLRQNSGPLDEILVYGMDPEIYWLSGYKSPTRDTWSVNEKPENKIIILEKLKNHEFRYVVLFERLTELYPEDSIINFVRNNYRVVKIIGLAYVYSF
jgi:4-amino-4-deoxy-L-arabinose transferase-like glycosyltransferase